MKTIQPFTVAHSKTTRKPTSYSMGYSVENGTTINSSFNSGTTLISKYLPLDPINGTASCLYVKTWHCLATTGYTSNYCMPMDFRHGNTTVLASRHYSL